MTVQTRRRDNTRAHVRIYPSKDMIIAEPEQRYDAVEIRRMGAGDECTHGRYLVATAAKHATIIITRACVQPAFVHTQTVRLRNYMLRFTNRLARHEHADKREEYEQPAWHIQEMHHYKNDAKIIKKMQKSKYLLQNLLNYTKKVTKGG